jgi:L-ascorbate metabolism protein UlaG (beta-lactamase superfamily)
MGGKIAALGAKMLGVESVVPIHFGTFPVLSGRPEDLTQASWEAFEVVSMEPGQALS